MGFLSKLFLNFSGKDGQMSDLFVQDLKAVDPFVGRILVGKKTVSGFRNGIYNCEYRRKIHYKQLFINLLLK